jgi:hypothetical protein
MGRVGGQRSFVLVPESDSDYLIEEENVRLSFTREAGKVTGFTGYQSGHDFLAKRVD